jgi:hypothetical protein
MNQFPPRPSQGAPPVSTTPAANFETSFASVVDIGGKFELRTLRDFSKKFETALMVYSVAWGKPIHEKTKSRKSRDTVPLNVSTDQLEIGRGVKRYSARPHLFLKQRRYI